MFCQISSLDLTNFFCTNPSSATGPSNTCVTGGTLSDSSARGGLRLLSLAGTGVFVTSLGVRLRSIACARCCTNGPPTRCLLSCRIGPTELDLRYREGTVSRVVAAAAAPPPEYSDYPKSVPVLHSPILTALLQSSPCTVFCPFAQQSLQPTPVATQSHS
eukprot:4253723-Amphidinium_carterae.3